MIKILRMGYNATHDSNFSVNRPNGYDWYLLLLIKSSAIFTIDGEEITTTPNTLIIYDKNIPHEYRANGTEYKNDWIHFELEQDILNQYQIPLNKPLDIQNYYYLSDLIQKSASEFFSNNPCKDQTIHYLMMLILIKASEQLKEKKTANLHIQMHDELVKLRSEIYSNPHNNWSITEMAAKLHISNGYLHNIYKETFLTSCMSDVIQSRIAYAKELLAETDWPIGKISYLCGYNNEVHFMRQFKKLTSLTPKEFRESMGLL